VAASRVSVSPRFVAFFSEPLGSLIKYFLGVDATAGHIPEFAAAKVVPGMFKASERNPRDIVRSEIPPPSSSSKLRGPQDENVFESGRHP